MAKIFHLIDKHIWDATNKDTNYSPSSLQQEGFIHCCKADQILLVAEKYFTDKQPIALLRINTADIQELIKSEVPVETPHSGLQFPHVYGAIPMDAIEKEFRLKVDSDGQYELPSHLLS